MDLKEGLFIAGYLYFIILTFSTEHYETLYPHHLPLILIEDELFWLH